MPCRRGSETCGGSCHRAERWHTHVTQQIRIDQSADNGAQQQARFGPGGATDVVFVFTTFLS